MFILNFSVCHQTFVSVLNRSVIMTFMFNHKIEFINVNLLVFFRLLILLLRNYFLIGFLLNHFSLYLCSQRFVFQILLTTITIFLRVKHGC